MNLKHRYQIIASGEIVEGAYLGAWDTLENLCLYQSCKNYDEVEAKFGANWSKLHCDWKIFGSGIWVPAKNCRIPYSEVTDLHVPFDRYDNEIMVGDIIIYAMRDLTVAKMKIENLVTKNNECIMHGTDVDSKRKTRNSYPHRCIKIS